MRSEGKNSANSQRLILTTKLEADCLVLISNKKCYLIFKFYCNTIRIYGNPNKKFTAPTKKSTLFQKISVNNDNKFTDIAVAIAHMCKVLLYISRIRLIDSQVKTKCKKITETYPMMGHDTQRLPGLDLLRSIAIIWVMLFHSFVVGGLGPDWAWLSRYGWMGVDLFFVLSGFLIGTQVLKSLNEKHSFSFRDFYLRRAFRILPAYWVVLLLYLAWPNFSESSSMESWWKFATFMLNISIDYNNNAAFSHAWSLCVEEHFYLLFPLLAVLLMRRPSMRKFATLCLFLILSGIALRSFVWLNNAAIDPNNESNWFVVDIYYPTWNRLDGLLCGVALAAWKVLRPESWKNARRYSNSFLFFGLLVMALAIWLFRDRVGLVGNSIGWPILSAGLGLLVFSAAGREGLIGRLNIPGAGWLAAISYSLYLIHKPIYHLVQMYWGEHLHNKGFIAVLAYAGAAIAAGALLHYTVELPALRLRDRLPFCKRRRDPSTVSNGIA